MAYRVEIARNAEAELEELYLWVVERAPQQGAAWFNGLERAVLSLDQHPKRCPVAPESIDPDHPVRVLTYGRKPHVYRVFFTVDDNAKVVRVVHVRRGARQRPTAGELAEIDSAALETLSRRTGDTPPGFQLRTIVIGGATSASATLMLIRNCWPSALTEYCCRFAPGTAPPLICV